MKISFSSSPDSSFSSSFDENLNKNSENVTTKCFSSILRRFLCSGNLRTHPLDSCMKQVDGVVGFDYQKDLKIQAHGTPGLVARLMGLDSFPSKEMSTVSDSIGRSRSVNSMDFRLESDQTHGRHRRVKSSVPFSERPAILEMENDEFLLLSFGESNGSEMGFSELKQKNIGNQRVFNKRNCDKQKQNEKKIASKPRRKDVERREIKGLDSSLSKKPKDRVKHREVSDSSKLGKNKNKMKNKSRSALKKVEPESDTHNSSPVSVLDIDDFEFEQGSHSSEDESKKKLTPDFAMSSDRPSIHFSRISTGEVPELRKVETQRRTKEIDTHSEEYIQLWGEVCRLTEVDMKTSNWMQKMEEFEEIGSGFGLEILGQLLHEIAEEIEELRICRACNVMFS